MKKITMIILAAAVVLFVFAACTGAAAAAEENSPDTSKLEKTISTPAGLSKPGADAKLVQLKQKSGKLIVLLPEPMKKMIQYVTPIKRINPPKRVIIVK